MPTEQVGIFKIYTKLSNEGEKMTAFNTFVLFVVVILSSSTLLSVNSEKNINNRALKNSINIYNCIGIVILTILPGIQISSYGTDIYRYQLNFYRNSLLEWGDFFAKIKDKVGFYVIAKITYSIGGRILTFSFFSMIVVLLSYSFIKHNNKNISVFIATIIFFTGLYTTGMFNIVKQGVAISIILYGTRYIYNNDIKKFIICICLSYLIHGSAIICIIMYLFWDHRNETNISRNKACFYIVIGAIAVVFYQPLIDLFTSSITQFENYSSYSDIIESSNRDFWVDCLELALILLHRKKLCEANKKNESMIYLLILSVIIGFTGFYNPYFKRIALYFSVPSKIMLFGYLPQVYEGKSRFIMKMLITAFFVGLWVFVRFFIENEWTYNYDLSNIPY